MQTENRGTGPALFHVQAGAQKRGLDQNSSEAGPRPATTR